MSSLLGAIVGSFVGAFAALALYEKTRSRERDYMECRIMTKLTDLQEGLSGLDGVIGQVKVNVASLLQMITDLKSQQGSGSEVTGADLDTLIEEVKTMRATLAEVSDKSDDPLTPPAA